MVTIDANKHCQRMKRTKGKKPNEKQYFMLAKLQFYDGMSS